MRLSRRSVLCAAAGLAGCRRTRDAQTSPGRPPGAAIAFVRRAGPDELQGHGDLTPDTLVEAASLSKPVFAFAVLAHSQTGALELDAPLTTIMPPPYAHQQRGGVVDAFADPRLAHVTARLVLSHRSGLPNWSRDRPLAFEAEPGARWIYSGEAYVLLQRSIEHATGEPLDDFVRRRVFAPLGMTQSTFDARRAPGRAMGHDRAGSPVASSVGAPMAATSLVTTAREYARFARRLIERPEDDPVVDAMLTRSARVDADLQLDWGLGIGLAAPDSFFHWGANPGVRSLLVGSRSRGEALVVLTNGEGGMAFARQIVRARFGDLALLRFPMIDPPD